LDYGAARLVVYIAAVESRRLGRGKIATGEDMTRLRWAGVGLLWANIFVGCTTQKEPQQPKPEPASLSDDAVAAYRRKHPEALIGRVVAVRPQDRLLSVGDVPVVDFRQGDAVTFLGASDQQIGSGQVINIMNERLIVRYEAGGGREPLVGDLVVRFK
jgi:hypothetical protein